MISEIRIVANADASLIEDPTGRLSNSKDSSGNFVGMTNNFEARRLLVAFDLSVVPRGAKIESAILKMHMSRTSGDDAVVSLHRVTTKWHEGSSDANGEGGGGAPSTPGDPTWVHAAFREQLWNHPGGDYTVSASAVTSIGGVRDYEWSSEDLAADVRSWITDPSSNNGWIAIGGESQSQTAKRFDSRENNQQAFRPTLVLLLVP